MQRSIPWLWILLVVLLLLAPGPAGRLLLDLVGGLTITLLLLPVFLAGAGLVAWKLLQSRLRTCPACGFRSLGTDLCPACGAPFEFSDSGISRPDQTLDACDVTIDVVAQPVQEPEQDG